MHNKAQDVDRLSNWNEAKNICISINVTNYGCTCNYYCLQLNKEKEITTQFEVFEASFR